MLYPSSHPFQRSQLVNPSAPFPSLNQESKHLYHSLSPSSRFSSFLFLHCFHMLPYPLNLTQLGRVELSSPDTRRTTYTIPYPNTFPARLVCLLFHSLTVGVSTAREGQRSDVCEPNQTYKCYKPIWKKLVQKKRQWRRIPL